MRILYTIITGIAVLCGGAACAADLGLDLSEIEAPDVMAQVGDTQITKAEVDRTLWDWHAYQTCEKLILRSIVRQAAQTEGLTVTEDEVNLRLAGLRIPPGATVWDMLKTSGMTMETLKADLRHGTYLDKLVSSRLQIPEEEMDQVWARQIVIHLPVAATEEETAEREAEALAKAQDLYNQLQGGTDFAELAKLHSDDQITKGRGGDMSYFRRGVYGPEIDEVAFSLEPGEISEPFETPRGIIILKVEARKPFSELPPEEQEKVRKEALAEKEKATRDKLMSDLRSAAEVVRLYEFHRGDPDTPVPEVVARVNGEDITRSQLHKAVWAYNDFPAVEQLVVARLLRLKAQQMGITATDEDFQKKVEGIEKSGRRLEELLDGIGMTMDAFRTRSEPEFLGRHIIDKLVQFDDSVMDNVTVRHIAIRIPLGSSPAESARLEDEARIRADEIRKQILDGADYAELAKQHSADLTNREKGGEFGEVRRGELPPYLEGPAFTMEAGAVSDLIRSGSAFHILKVDERNFFADRTPEMREIDRQKEEDRRKRALSERIIIDLEAEFGVEKFHSYPEE